MLKKLKITGILILLFQSLFAQNLEQTDFNLPPGVVFHEKTFKKIDYSYKLDNDLKNSNEATNFLKKFNEEEKDKIFKGNDDYSSYYKNALEYFNSLSKNVKLIYNEEELWYIYMFDQKLKNKLQKIK